MGRTELIIAFVIVLVICFLAMFLVGNREYVYTDREGNYYRWLETKGNMRLWRPLKKVWFLYFPNLNKDDFWLNYVEQEFVTMNALLLLYDEEEIDYVKWRIEKYDNSHPKEDNILFVKEIQDKLHTSRDRVFQLIQKVRRSK